MRPDHSSTPNESLPPSSSSVNTGRPSAQQQQQQGGSAGAAATTSSRGMGGSGRAHGERGGGGAARQTKAVDVPELVLKLCKIVLKKERDVSVDDAFVIKWKYRFALTRNVAQVSQSYSTFAVSF